MHDYTYERRYYQCDRQKPAVIEYKYPDLLGIKIGVEDGQDGCYYERTATEAGKQYNGELENDKRNHSTSDETGEGAGPDISVGQSKCIPYSSGKYSAGYSSKRADTQRINGRERTPIITMPISAKQSVTNILKILQP